MRISSAQSLGTLTSAQAPVCRVRLLQPRPARQSSTGSESTADTRLSNWNTNRGYDICHSSVMSYLCCSNCDKDMHNYLKKIFIG